jgi:hypothetical protein
MPRPRKPVEDRQRVERAGRALRVVLDGLDRQLAVAQALDRPVVEVTWLTWKPELEGSDPPTTWTSWFWAVTCTTPDSRSRTGWFHRDGEPQARVSAPAARPTIWWPRQIRASGRTSRR